MMVMGIELPVVKPLTEDGLFGFDAFDQLTVCEVEKRSNGPRVTSWHIADVRKKTCMICNHGWEPTGPALADQIFWDLTKEFVHSTCLSRHCGLIERQDVRNAIVQARIRFNGLVPVPNGYDSSSSRPWYRADLLDYPYRLLIGWRKRVWEIALLPRPCAASSPDYERSLAVERLADQPPMKLSIPWWGQAKMEFDAENVTKEFGEPQILLHAWSDDALRDYIRRLAEVGGLAKEIS